ncbi:DUF3027 domain-containing protein [Leifsonia virtsii]|uniref:DUF3027 domain-containing protein n=1 Tax=Leifsonia virtsii TaxID=3035915 RepID=A0ABT8IYX0_9MICO|nr:DUF3027 domain-containing protein [Leifsonia virtsii]MDN4597572.1 DUF3027 domain-containing protein [Leifsonia virtsii]
MPELGDEVDPAAETPAGETGAPADAAAEGAEAAEAAEPEVELVADPELVAAVPLARQALAEITPERTIGEPLGHVVEAPGVVSLLFASLLPGYPDWRWTVTVGRTGDDEEPTVLEAELMPGDGSLLAPDWVPWSERLAEYQAAQEALAAQEAESAEDEDDDESDDDESGDDADAEDDHDIHDLHAGDDLDGVDIDSVDVDFDEETDVDSDLDLEAEEAAALADADDDESDEGDEDDDSDDDESDEDE